MEKLITILKNAVGSRYESVSFYDSADDNSCKTFLFTDVPDRDFSLIEKSLEACFNPISSERTLDNTVFSSYHDGDYNIFLVFDKADNTLRVTADKNTNLPADAPVDKGQQIKFWQYEIDHSLIDCGMCYIFRLSDGTFFIIDSAHQYSVNDDIRIVDFLKQQTPEGEKVIVTAWFFSHGHDDHIAKFLDILRYNKEIEIKGFYFNFPPFCHPDAQNWSESGKRKLEQFYSELERHSDIPVYRLHTGQSFYIDNLLIDVICTHEDVQPLSLDNYNDSSTVLMVTVGRDKICFPGDAGHLESDILERRYPSFLKCDIVQVAHHGHFGTKTEFYKLAGADVALFASTQVIFDGDYDRYEPDRYICENYKHYFIASNGTVEFSFPLKNSEIKLYPDEIFENFDGIFNLWTYQYTDEYKNELRNRFENQNGSIIKY